MHNSVTLAPTFQIVDAWQFESDMVLSMLIPGTDPQVLQLTISRLWSRLGSSFGFPFCLRNVLTKNTLLLIWNFVLHVKQAKGNNTRLILAGLIILISFFLNKPGVQGSQPCWHCAPSWWHHVGRAQHLANPTWLNKNLQKQMAKERLPPKQKSLSRHVISYFHFIFSLCCVFFSPLYLFMAFH